MRIVSLTLVLMSVCRLCWGGWQEERIARDLRPFEPGITARRLDRLYRLEEGIAQSTLSRLPGFVDHYGRVVIRDQLVSYLSQGHHGRADCVVRTLQKVADQYGLPDLDLIICLHDSLPEEAQGPIFCFAKRAHHDGILIPDFEMMVGYHDWIDYEAIMAQEPGWSSKIPIILWRGGTTGGQYTRHNWDSWPRSRLCLMSLDYPEILDAKFTSFPQCNRGVAEILAKEGLTANYAPVLDQLRYKYLIDVDGNSCTYSRFYWILRSSSVPLKVLSNDIQWYYEGLEPWVHYAPISSDLSNLLDVYSYLEDQEIEARRIALQSREFALENLNEEAVLLYIHDLLVAYSQLLVGD